MATILLNQSEQTSVSLSVAPGKLRGSLTLDFESDKASGATFLAASTQQPPLCIVRPFRLEDGSVLVHLHNVSGGLLAGDCLQMSVSVGAGASVQLTSTGATRVYRSKENSPPTLQIAQFKIAENGLLEYIPDAIIPFARARFRQQTMIDIKMGGGLFWWEILAPGRLARGEVFEYECVELRTDLKANGRIIAAESVRLQPQLRELSSVARLGPYRYWTTFYIIRVGLDASCWLVAEQKLRELVIRFHRAGETIWAVSTLPAHGLVVQGLARGGKDIISDLRAIWTEAKLHVYGRGAIPPRKLI